MKGELFTMARKIPFSPPDITQAEIDEVADTLRSGWITTGPKTKRFEKELSAFMGTPCTAALNSATAALECALRVLGIGPGDEVITSAYTYTSSASCILHVGATPVMCDVKPGTYEMDYDRLPELITDKTRAIIPVDLAGRMIDYDRLFEVLDSVSASWKPQTDIQSAYTRIPVLADGAHSFGASYHGVTSGNVADFTAFSFHAVKNLTTAEGGALTWRETGFDSDAVYKDLMLMSLHGQNKDALAKTHAGAWEYDIKFPGWKCNMTDIMASLGLVQLKRYPGMLARRRALVSRYEANLADAGVDIITHYSEDGAEHHETTPLTDEQAAAKRAAEAASQTGFASSGHLMLVRLTGHDSDFRNAVITELAENGVAANVHYKPLPMMTAYRNLGFDIANYPNAYEQFKNEITLPLHTLLSDDDVDYVCDQFKRAIAKVEANGAAK
jgi:dTDP-4-amino-4,6-dideoxygalactose transaminase